MSTCRLSLADLIGYLSEEKRFKGINGKDESSFLRSPTQRQIEYFANNLNESVYNSHERTHQKLIAHSCLIASPLLMGAKGNYKEVLREHSCDFDARLKTFLKKHGEHPLEECVEDRVSVLKNLAKASKIKPTKAQEQQIISIQYCDISAISFVYNFIINPMIGNE